MAKHGSYKDSGVKWLGEIPSHWEVKKLRAFFDRRNQKVSDKDYAPLSVTKNGIVPQMENVAKSKDSDNRRLVKVGDFVINSRSDRKGSSGVSQLEGSVSFVNTVMTPKLRILPSFSNYLLKSSSFIEENYRNGHGIVADLWTTSFDEQKHIYLAVPPKEEQEAIVEYLDKVTSDIDKAIEAQQKLIDALNERKQIIITNAVTKGLDSTVELKYSGIDWLGQIPEDWEVAKVKNVVKITNGSDPKMQGLIPVYGSGSESFKTCGEYKEGPAVLLGRKGATLHIPHWIEGKYWNVDTAFDVKTISKKFILKYFYYISICFDYPRYISQTTLPSMTQTIYKNIVIPFPSIVDQEKIVEYLDKKSEELNLSILNCEKMISLLQERKQIIINDVVTGKKKVI